MWVLLQCIFHISIFLSFIVLSSIVHKEKQMWTQGLSKLPFQAPLPACWGGTFFVLKELSQAPVLQNWSSWGGFWCCICLSWHRNPLLSTNQCQLSCPTECSHPNRTSADASPDSSLSMDQQCSLSVKYVPEAGLCFPALKTTLQEEQEQHQTCRNQVDSAAFGNFDAGSATRKNNSEKLDATTEL